MEPSLRCLITTMGGQIVLTTGLLENEWESACETQWPEQKHSSMLGATATVLTEVLSS